MGRGDWIRRSAAAIALAVGAPALAQATHRFNVPAQPAATGIPEFARQAGIQIVAPSDGLTGRRIPAVRGTMTTDAALARLIQGTGLSIASNAAGTVVLRLSGDARGGRGDAADAAFAPAAQDIVVTAQRRAEREQDVPISLTAFGQKTIERQRINQLEDLSRVTPNLLVSTFSLASPIIAIRGASNTFNQIGVNKPVGIFVDDVYVPRNSAATLELFGVKSIEVLRGPQGTLFGRNVTGGAIVIDTGKPAFDGVHVNARASYGEYNTRELDGVVDVPLSATTAVRVAGLLRQHGGWGRDRLTGQTLDDQDSKAIRGQLRLALTPRVEFLLAGDYASDASGGRTLSSIAAGDDGDIRTAEIGVPQRFRRTQGGVSGRLFVDTPLGQITSITAWRRSRATDLYSNVGANYVFLAKGQSQLLSDDRDRVSTFSQEVRLASPAWRHGNFVLGAYFSDERSTRTLGTTALAAATGALVTNQLADQATIARSYALFADGTVAPLPWLSLTLGGRYTWDHKEARLVRTDFITARNGFDGGRLATDWSEFTPRAVLKITPMRDLMFYASYARGYTAGGYNTEAATLVAFQRPFQPETVDNYEAGFKSELFDRHIRLNATAFEMKYHDKQELFFDNTTRILNIYNAARATMKGIEGEFAIRPAPEVTLSATYGLLDTRYDSFVIPGGANYTGNRLGSSPHDKVSFTLDIDVPVGRGRVFGNLVYSSTGTYNTGAAADPGLIVRGYNLVNGTAGVGLGNGVELAVFGRNIFNTAYVLIPSTQTVRALYYGAPRVIGGSVTLRF